MPRTEMSMRLTFLRGEAGSSTAEYAVFLGLITVVVISLAQVVGQRVGDSTISVARVLEEGPEHNIVNRDSDWRQTILEDGYSRQIGMAVQIFICSVIFVYILKRTKLQKQTKESTKSKPKIVEENRFQEERERILTILRAHRTEFSSWAIRVEHILDSRYTAVTSVAKRDHVRDALSSSEHSSILVTDKSGQLLGVITEREMESSPASRASQIMTREPVTVDAQSHLSAAVTILQEQKLDCMPVMSNGVVRGVLSMDSIMAVLLCMLQLATEIDAEYRAILHRAVGSSPATACPPVTLNTDENVATGTLDSAKLI